MPAPRPKRAAKPKAIVESSSGEEDHSEEADDSDSFHSADEATPEPDEGDKNDVEEDYVEDKQATTPRKPSRRISLNQNNGRQRGGRVVSAANGKRSSTSHQHVEEEVDEDEAAEGDDTFDADASAGARGRLCAGGTGKPRPPPSRTSLPNINPHAPVKPTLNGRVPHPRQSLTSRPPTTTNAPLPTGIMPSTTIVGNTSLANSGGLGVGNTTAFNMGKVSREEMSSNFEEWMKMATDNKITATNTWNFALIDYFADLTLLRNVEDQSINFQKASCTLDGCVKIWTSRVDSVATETGKLLSGLSTNNNSSEGRDGGEGGSDDEDGAGGDGDGEEGGETQGRGNKKKKRSSPNGESTLAKSFDPLRAKKLDLEFSVDPLFKKTCADFDEGGAMGLLMNHLGLDGRGRVVFDAGDVEVEREEEGDEEEEGGEGEGEGLELDKLEEFVPSLEDVNARTISVTLSDFKFSSDPTQAFNISLLTSSDRDDEMGMHQGTSYSRGSGAGAGGEGAGVQDFFGGEDMGEGGFGDGGRDGDDGGEYDYGGGGGDGDDNDYDGDAIDDQNQPHSAGLGPGAGHGKMAMGYGPIEPFDPRRQGEGAGLVMAMDEGEGLMLDYFDQGYLKNWAGPEHWKLRKVARRDTSSANATGSGTNPTAPRPRKEKLPFLIDFDSPSTITTKKLFEPGTKSAISLPAPKTKKRKIAGNSKGKKGKKQVEVEVEERDEHLLPDDMHFSSRQLLRLFLKPKFTLKMRRQGAVAKQLQEGHDADIDENFWASAAAERAEVDAGGDDDDGDAGGMGFDTEFFHDDPDADDYAMVDDGLLGSVSGDAEGGSGAVEEDDLWAGTQGQLKRARPETVHYAKRAKKVDVKRLKDNIWKGLDMRLPETPAEVPDTDAADIELVEERSMTNVIQNLRTAYPSEKMAEISTSFCFICLLHLANEEGLKIDAGADGKVAEEERIGALEQLKVWKDLNAGQAA